ncbi:MAG: HindVP family restriction endonuclease, partial [Prevotellaceae bacterium]|nr:HindVP family restriction endonuclease [Prevotellaceae bacterium]
MSSKGIPLVYLHTDKKNKLTHSHITAEKVFGIDPLSDKAYYNFEAGFPPYEQYYKGDREKTDLVMMDRETGKPLCGLEVKLTALPDNSTKSEPEERYGCEIVVRPPTVCFLACSICRNYDTPKGRNRLHSLLMGVPQINHWEEAEEVAQHYGKIEEAVLAVSADVRAKQVPLIMQPVWKTLEGKRLADDCLDVFVWSNLATIQMCVRGQGNEGVISRFQRTIVWIYKMLFDFSVYGDFDYVRIIKNHSYGNANDKAFALSGKRTFPLLSCPELMHPRIG